MKKYTEEELETQRSNNFALYEIWETNEEMNKPTPFIFILFLLFIVIFLGFVTL